MFPFSGQTEPAGKLTAVEGRVDITSPDEEARPAQVGDEISVGDIVRSKSESKAEITFHDGNILRFAQNTRVRTSEYKVGEEGSKGILKLFSDKIQSIVYRVLEGTWGFEASGSYGRYTWSDNWSLHLHNSAQDPEIHRWAEVVGSKWSGTVISGKVAGAWVNLEDAMTGVTGGALEGSYNPTQNTWQSLAEGKWMETRRFLQMAATSYDSTSDSYTFNTTGNGLSETQENLLHGHNIPRIEIGRADLTGSNNFQDGSMSVTMHDVTFFAYSTGRFHTQNLGNPQRQRKLFRLTTARVDDP